MRWLLLFNKQNLKNVFLNKLNKFINLVNLFLVKTIEFKYLYE